MEVWAALTNPENIDSWGGGPAKMDEKVGSAFSLWGGDIWGKNIEVEHQRILKQEWYGGDWPEPSIVTFILKERAGATIVQLIHEKVPENELKSIEQGWKEYYMGPLKDFVEQ
jgi:activator of HSP90 ATPase